MRGFFQMFSHYFIPTKNTLRGSLTGFSLVEVVLALGVAAFVLIALVGLVPTGLRTARESMEESRALNLLGEVVTDRNASPTGLASLTYQLPGLTNTQAAIGFFGVDDRNRKTGSLSEARFRIDYRITPPPAGGKGPFVGNFRASWPAVAQTPEGSAEIVATFFAP
jgi:type II secretory pathway pseudopilin PulG